MKDLANTLRSIASQLDLIDVENLRKEMENSTEISRLERGNKALQEVIKLKDDVSKEIIESLRPSNKKKE